MMLFQAKPWSVVLAMLVAGLFVAVGQVCPAAAQEQTAAASPAQGVEMLPAEAEYWNDPDFRRRFVESYIAETDLEPKPTSQQEVDLINQTLDLMRAENIDAALNAALEGREDETFSVLIDFLIANLYLNTAMNLEDPGDGASEADIRAYQERREQLLDDSANYYKIAVVKFPKYRRAWRNLGLVHVRMQRFDEARKAFSQVIQLGGGDPDTYGLLGFAYTSLGQHLPAESAYRMANMLEPEERNWEMGLIRSFLLQKRYPEAVALTQKLLDQDPTDEQLWLFQANAYIGMDQIDKASKNYEILNGLGKSSIQSVTLLADIYTNKGLYDTAVVYYRQAIELANTEESSEKLLTSLLRSARVLSSRGEPARPATKALIQTIETSFKDRINAEELKSLLMLKARLALADGEGDQEAEILEEVIKLDPLDGEAMVLLGQYNFRKYRELLGESTEEGDAKAQAAMNHLDQATLYYERAANLQDDDVVADALVYHAQALVQSDRAAQAVPLLSRAQKLKYRESVQAYLEAVQRMSK